jgi:hypothetical protein
VALAIAGLIRAAAPELDQLFPISFQPGTTNLVTLVGKPGPWPPGCWTDHPGITLQPGTNAAACAIATPCEIVHASMAADFLISADFFAAFASAFSVLSSAAFWASDRSPAATSPDL